MMTLDPQAQALLDQIAASTLPRIHQMTPEQARQMYDMSAKILDVQGVPIGKVEDSRLPGPGGDIPIRIYTPVAAPSGPLPALVFFHGGGFVIGSLDSHDAPCRQLANGAMARVIAVDYRLAPEHPFPAAIEDALAAVKWVARNAATLEIDPTRIAVGGDSAGGNLAAVASQMLKGSADVTVAFQLLIYPAVDRTRITRSMEELANGYMLDADTMNWFSKQYLPEGWDPADLRLSPARAPSLAGLPPAHVVTAGFDPLKDEGRLYAEALAAAGVKATHTCYEHTVHGFVNMAGAMEVGRTALADCAAILKNALA
jgi:acetyl esterase